MKDLGKLLGQEQGGTVRDLCLDKHGQIAEGQLETAEGVLTRTTEKNNNFILSLFLLNSV